VKLPEGFNGFFIHMDHRLIDSCGLVVMINDLMQLYTHYRFGAPFPQELADYTRVLENDIRKATNEKRFAKDKKFWNDQLDVLGEPLYSDIKGPGVLEEARRKHRNPELRAADIEMKNLFVQVKDYYLEPDATQHLMDFCMNHQLSMTNLLLLGIRTYLSKANGGQEDITIENFISRRSTHDEWTSGGSRTIMFPCRTVITGDTDFISAAYEIQSIQNKIYLHSNYDPALITEEMRKRYNTPKYTSYESCYLTYQPMPVKMDNPHLENIRQHSKWFANGAATKKMYLTVSHTEYGGMCFSYHYQTACYDEHDMELLYYYMMRILFKGIAEPDMTIGEIIEVI
ncbi:MAG: chromosome condensation protein, partial [Blautia sp.]|nr:chromosome condensation protein [Blautia sp.]